MSQPAHRAAANQDLSGACDFDFLFGRWNVAHRRLRARLCGDDRWEAFTGTMEAWPMLGGLGNVDDNWLDLPAGAYRAATLRTFDPASGMWSIWWIDGRNPRTLDVPVRGWFEDGTGLFCAEDTHEGRPIRVRFVWSDITAHSAKWSQAFSPDAGETWEVNWEMEFTRRV